MTMWPFSKIAELERRIKYLEDRDCAPKMVTDDWVSYSHPWRYTVVPDAYKVDHSDAIRAILKHLDLDLVKTLGTPAQVEVKKKQPPLTVADWAMPCTKPTTKKRK